MAGSCGESSVDKTLQLEAEAVIEDVSFAVKEVQISHVLPATGKLIYLNLTTQENDTFCVELSNSGFRLVGKEYDTFVESYAKLSSHYETVYSLLDTISPKYRDSFGNALLVKLQRIQQEEHNLLEDT